MAEGKDYDRMTKGWCPTAAFTNRIWIKVVIRTKERMEWLKVL